MSDASDAIFEAMGAGNLSILGVSAVYSPTVGDDVECQVWLDQDIKYQVDQLSGQIRALGYEIEGIISDLGQEPERGPCHLPPP